MNTNLLSNKNLATDYNKFLKSEDIFSNPLTPNPLFSANSQRTGRSVSTTISNDKRNVTFDITAPPKNIVNALKTEPFAKGYETFSRDKFN